MQSEADSSDQCQSSAGEEGVSLVVVGQSTDLGHVSVSSSPSVSCSLPSLAITHLLVYSHECYNCDFQRHRLPHHSAHSILPPSSKSPQHSVTFKMNTSNLRHPHQTRLQSPLFPHARLLVVVVVDVIAIHSPPFTP